MVACPTIEIRLAVAAPSLHRSSPITSMPENALRLRYQAHPCGTHDEGQWDAGTERVAERDPQRRHAKPGGETGHLFMHGWYAYGGGRGIVTELLGPRELVLMHHRWVQAPQEREHVEQLRPEAAADLPPVTVFAAELERKTFQIR